MYLTNLKRQFSLMLLIFEKPFKQIITCKVEKKRIIAYFFDLLLKNSKYSKFYP